MSYRRKIINQSDTPPDDQYNLWLTKYKSNFYLKVYDCDKWINIAGGSGGSTTPSSTPSINYEALIKKGVKLGTLRWDTGTGYAEIWSPSYGLQYDNENGKLSIIQYGAKTVSLPYIYVENDKLKLNLNGTIYTLQTEKSEGGDTPTPDDPDTPDPPESQMHTVNIIVQLNGQQQEDYSAFLNLPSPKKTQEVLDGKGFSITYSVIKPNIHEARWYCVSNRNSSEQQYSSTGTIKIDSVTEDIDIIIEVRDITHKLTVVVEPTFLNPTVLVDNKPSNNNNIWHLSVCEYPQYTVEFPKTCGRYTLRTSTLSQDSKASDSNVEMQTSSIPNDSDYTLTLSYDQPVQVENVTVTTTSETLNQE